MPVLLSSFSSVLLVSSLAVPPGPSDGGVALPTPGHAPSSSLPDLSVRRHALVHSQHRLATLTVIVGHPGENKKKFTFFPFALKMQVHFMLCAWSAYDLGCTEQKIPFSTWAVHWCEKIWYQQLQQNFANDCFFSHETTEEEATNPAFQDQQPTNQST